MKKTLTTLAAFGMLALLTACGGGPGDGDLRAALEQQVKSEMQQAIKMMSGIGGSQGAKMAKEMVGDPDAISIKNLTSEDMRKTDQGDYVAKVSFDVMNGSETNRANARVTVTKVDGAWKIIHLDKI